MVPKRLFFTKGVGKHKERLTSFELALRDAGIAAQNLVRVSSIFPPQCKLVTRKEGLKYLNPGEVVFAVVAENSTREPHRLVVSSIGVAIPTDKNTYGYLSEHHSFGETEDQAGDYAEELAAEMLATTLDVEFDPGQELGREEGNLPDVGQDCAYSKCDAVRRRRQKRPMDDDHRCGDSDLRRQVDFSAQRIRRRWF